MKRRERIAFPLFGWLERRENKANEIHTDLFQCPQIGQEWSERCKGKIGRIFWLFIALKITILSISLLLTTPPKRTCSSGAKKL